MRTRAEYVRAETAALLDSLRGVWDETAVDEWAHALQAAACAIADDADEELILAAALHDIGHSPLLGGPHGPFVEVSADGRGDAEGGEEGGQEGAEGGGAGRAGGGRQRWRRCQ